MRLRWGWESRTKWQLIRGLLFTLTWCAIIALKLGGVTDWSWWWVLSPLWLSPALTLVLLGLLIFAFALAALYARIRLRFRLRRAFPEVFLADPTLWSRIATEHPGDHEP
jgi:Transmembrane Fragile-X-F protein